VLELPPEAERHVVLGDLIALGEVGVEVVLAVKEGALGDLALERQPDHDPEVNGAGVEHGQRTREAQAYRAGVDVWRVAEGQRTAAEHLRPRRELDVDLQADDRLPVHRRAALPSKPIARSSA